MLFRNHFANYGICVLALVCAIFLIQGCGSSSDTAERSSEINQDQDEDEGNLNIGLETFSSNEALRAYILDQYSKSLLPQSAYGPSWNRTDDPSDSMPAPATEGDMGDNSAGQESSDDFSETNVQEQGVDEADKVKNNGRYIYVAGDQTVHIVDAEDPASMREISTLTVNGHVDSLYLYDNLLAVIYIPLNGGGYPWGYAGGAEPMNVGFCYWLPVNAETGVLLVDISDPSLPRKAGDTIIEGNLISTRRIESKLYLVQQFLPELPPIDYYYGETQSREELIAANLAKLQTVTLAQLIPSYRTVDANGIESDNAQLVSYDHFYQPSETSGGSIVTVTTFDLDHPPAIASASGVIADAHTIYASADALYLASTRWNYSAYEVDDSEDIYQTYLFKLSFTDQGVVCTGTGSVAGKILNQFSLGEYEDILRIATTNGEAWMGNGSVSNNVYCLKVEGESLNVIGKIEGIAPGESIYAARFLGSRGYLVTFVKVDPLFTLDLSDPYHPAIAGELKVPGYSDYIHPISDEYIIAIGKAATVYQGTAWYQGVQLSMFDVRDFKNPTLLFTETIGDRGTYSEALANHKAFTYWASRNLLAIPIDLYEISSPIYPYDYGEYQYSGLYVYAVSPQDGFTHLGTLQTNHSQDAFPPSWTRGLFIDNHVFAVEQNAVHCAEYDSIATTMNTLNLFP